jgi:LCP family protein required for cell wall assembly
MSGSEPQLKRKRRLRRTWLQRSVIGLNMVMVLGCLGAAGALTYTYNTVQSIKRIHTGSGVLNDTERPDNGPTATFADQGPRPPENWLITGSDSRDKGNCGITTGQYAGAFGPDSIGQRSDTIMVLRFDPDSNYAAILSFPRDLWVKVVGLLGNNRINSAFDPTDPTRLIQTIQKVFGVPVQHYANIDFCSFRDLVDAVGGVKINFDKFMRDKYTGIDMHKGCQALDGSAALAFVRSRHVMVSDDGKHYLEEGLSDLARIRRQQFLLKRIAAKFVADGVTTSPSKLNKYVKLFTKYVVVDDKATAGDLFNLASKLRNLDPNTVKTYTFTGSGQLVDGQSVIVPNMSDPNNKAIVAIFNGKALDSSAKTADEVNALAASTTGLAALAITPGKGPTTTTRPTTTVPTTTTPSGTTRKGATTTVTRVAVTRVGTKPTTTAPSAFPTLATVAPQGNQDLYPGAYVPADNPPCT